MADFLVTHHSGPQWLKYRRACLEHWRQHYGEQVAERVEKLVRARMTKEKAK